MATLIGTNSNNNLTGTAAADTMVGQAGNDQLLGNGGNDRLNGGTQNDVLNGGTGIDTADFSNLVIGGITYIGATAGVTVNLNLAGAQNTVGAGTRHTREHRESHRHELQRRPRRQWCHERAHGPGWQRHHGRGGRE